MFCSVCGRESADDAAFCTKCGKQFNQIPLQQFRPRRDLIGFSPKISDPAFLAYKKKSSTWSFLFATILAVIVIIAFPIYGNASGEIEWPNSLYYGIGIGGMFIAIAILQTLKRGTEKTWDGVVISKDIYKDTVRNDDGPDRHQTVYRIKIKKDSGGTKTHEWRDAPGLYDYYSTGDRVRHHKGFYYYEKYDKSQDSRIMCAACMSFQDINENICARCKCPLLK